MDLNAQVQQLQREVDDLKRNLEILMNFREFQGDVETIKHKVVFTQPVVFEGTVTGDNT